MTRAFDDAMVQGYEHLIEAMESPDPDDRHVLAAAVRAGASGIVTANTADFAAEFAASHDLLILHPDQFLLDLLDMAPGIVLRALEQQSADYTNPVRTVPEILDALSKSGTPEFASEMTSRLSSN
jgi:phosphoglycolate phosphatase-like HAD superfamily hydrolase